MCGVRVEQVSWASGGNAFRARLEELPAYLAQVTDRTPARRLVENFLAGGRRYRRAGRGSPAGFDAAGRAAAGRPSVPCGKFSVLSPDHS